jgi:hypothetical protein
MALNVGKAFLNHPEQAQLGFPPNPTEAWRDKQIHLKLTPFGKTSDVFS